MDENKSIHVNKVDTAEGALSTSVGCCQKYSQQITVAWTKRPNRLVYK